MSRQPELEPTEPTIYVYPIEYFQAQAEFDQKILQLNLSPNIQSALLNYTVTYRNLVGKNPNKRGPDRQWLEFVKGNKLDDKNFQVLTNQIWHFYTQQTYSVYKHQTLADDDQHFGSFIQKLSINKITNEQTIELHLNNRRRGQAKSDFSRTYQQERYQDVVNLFTSVKHRTANDVDYQPQWVSLTSWANNLPIINHIFPPDFTLTKQRIAPPNLNFRSNALWGQFINNLGKINQERLFSFRTNLSKAINLDQMVGSFPLPVTKCQSPIELFYNFYQIT